MQTRFVIVNADDFGLTSGINRGIIEAHERGIVTSASMMVRYPAAAEAAAYARERTQFSVGLHFEASEWRFEEGEWKLAYQIVEVSDESAVRAEFDRQLAKFEQLMGRRPTHLDSHQHVHLSEPTRTVLSEASERLGVPLRGCDLAIKYHGNFYGQTAEGGSYPAGISAGPFSDLPMRFDPGWAEIGCHPGYAVDLDSVYSSEREEEVRVLCSPEVRRAFHRNEVQLCSFQDYLTARKQSAPRLP